MNNSRHHFSRTEWMSTFISSYFERSISLNGFIRVYEVLIEKRDIDLDFILKGIEYKIP